MGSLKAIPPTMQWIKVISYRSHLNFSAGFEGGRCWHPQGAWCREVRRSKLFSAFRPLAFGIDFTIRHSSTHLLISWLCIAALGSSRQHSASVEQKDLKHHKDTTRRAARIWCCTRKVILVVLIVFSWHVLPQIPQIASVSTCSPVLLLRRFWNNLMPLHDELMSSPHLKTSVPYGLMFVNHLMLAEM